MRRLLLSITVLAVSILSLSPAPTALRGQTFSESIVFLVDGDLWAWNGLDSSLIQLTTSLHITEVVVSPDGTHLGFRALSPVTVDALERVGFFSGTWPADIGILDLTTRSVSMIATQPEDAALFVEGGSPDNDNVLMRSIPTWSPDGTAIAWTEIHYPSFASETNRLLIHNLANQATRVVFSDLPETAGVPGPLEVSWAGPGIALTVPSFNRSDSTFYTAIWLYSIDGDPVSKLRVPEDQQSVFQEFKWVLDDGHEMLGLFYFNSALELMDPQTGEYAPFGGQVELYSLTAPDISTTFTYTIDPDPEDFLRDFNWQATLADGRTIPLDYHGREIMIAPTGVDFAYTTWLYLHEDGRLVIWKDGVQIPDALIIDGMTPGYWGPTGWRVARSISKDN